MMTPKRAIVLLAAAVEELQADVEQLGCQCAIGDENKYHSPSRRRRDSRCQGVRLAVKHRYLVQRARRVASHMN